MGTSLLDQQDNFNPLQTKKPQPLQLSENMMFSLDEEKLSCSVNNVI